MTAPATSPPRRRWLRRLGIVAGAGVGVVGVALWALQTPAGCTWLSGQAQSTLQGLLSGGWTVDRPRLRWNLGGRVLVEDFVLRDPQGAVGIGVKRLDLALAPLSLLSGVVHVTSARLDGVDVRLDTDAEGVMGLTRAFGGPSTEPVDPDAPAWAGLPVTVRVDGLSLRDARIGQRTTPATPDAAPGGFEASVLSLTGGVLMPANRAEVRATDVSLVGVLLGPGPSPLTLDGDVTWSGTSLTLGGVRVGQLASRVTVDGAVDWAEGGVVDATLDAAPLDFGGLDVILGAGLRGTYEGALHAKGSLAGLDLTGALAGVLQPRDAAVTRGTLTLREGTRVCLPGYGVGAADACGGPDPVASDAPLRWSLAAGIDGFHVEDLAPVVGGPLRLEGELTGRGGGTSWPDGVFVTDGHWTGAELDVYGVRLRSLDAGLSLDDGVLRFSGLDLTGVVGRALGDGSLDLTTGQLRVDARGPLVPSMLADFGVTELGGAGRYAVTVRGDVYAPGAPIDVFGTATMAPMTWGGDGVVFERVEASFKVHVFEGVTDVLASIEATGVNAYGTLADRAAVPDLTVHVESGRVKVGGTLDAPLLRYPDYVTLVDGRATFVVDLPSDGERRVEVDLTGGMGDLLGFPTDDAAATLVMIDDDVRLGVTMSQYGEPLLSLPELRIDLASMTFATDRVRLAPSWRQQWENTAPVRFRISPDGGLADASIHLGSELGRVHLDGTIGPRGPLDAHLVLDELELGGVAELFPDLVQGLDGTATLDLTLSGDAFDPTVRGTIDVDRLFVEDTVRWLGLRGSIDVEQGVAALDVRSDVAGAPFLTLQGRVPVIASLASPRLASSGPVDLRLVLAPGGLSRVALAVPGVEVPEGALSGLVHVSGDLHDPDIDAELVGDAVVAGVDDRVRIELDLFRSAGHLDATLDAYAGYDVLLRSDARAATRLGEVMDWLIDGAPQPDLTDVSLFADDLDVLAWADAIPVQLLQRFAGVETGITGALTGQVGVRGDPRRPDVDVDLDAELVAGGTPADLHVGLAPSDGGYRLDAALGRGDAAWLTAAGRVPVAIDLSRDLDAWGVGEFDLAFGGAGVPLDVARAVLPELDVEAGTLRVEGVMDGTLTDPRPDVHAVIDGGRLVYRPIGIAVRDLTLRLSAEPAPDVTTPGSLRLRVDELRAETRPTSTSLDRLTQFGASRISGRGGVELREWRPADVDLAIDLTEAWLAASDSAVLRASGAVTAGGTWPNVHLDGALKVDQGRFSVNTSELADTTDVRLDPVIVVHRSQGTTTSRVEEGPHWYDGLSASVKLDLGRNTNASVRVPVLEDLGSFGASVTRADVDARMGGQLAIGLRGLDPTIHGEVEVLEGRVQVLRSRFDVVDGSHITFYGSDYAEPLFDITGAMGVEGGEVRLRLSGTPSSPKFDLSSDAFGSDAELFTILLTGQAPDELTSQQGRAALEAVGDLLLNNVLGGVNLGSVSVEADGTVSIGLPVYRTVYVETTVNPAPPLDENRITVQAEWSALPRLVIAAAYGDRRVWGNIFWEVRFDGPRRQRTKEQRRREVEAAQAVEAATDEAAPTGEAPTPEETPE